MALFCDVLPPGILYCDTLVCKVSHADMAHTWTAVTNMHFEDINMPCLHNTNIGGY